MADRIKVHQVGCDRYYKIWHTADQNMLIYMHSDGGCIVCRENTYPICKGALCFIGAKKYHYTMPEDPGSYDRSKVFMPAEAFERLTRLLHEQSPLRQLGSESFVYAQIPPQLQQRVEDLFQRITQTEADSRYGDAVYFSCYLHLLTILDKYAVESICVAPGQMSDAIQYINNNIGSSLQIEDICEAVHISKFHFCRQFKKATGMTVMRYILNTRLVLAKNLLDKEDRSITQISTHCGFSSASHFCRLFKKDTGLTPLQYRKQKRVLSTV